MPGAMLFSFTNNREFSPWPGGIGHGIGLGINFAAQVFPDVIRHFETLSRPQDQTADPTTSRFRSRAAASDLARPVRPIRGDGVERVGDGKDARSQRNLLALQVARIATAVEALLVGVDDLCGL